jgi:hypothetical protein
LKLPAIAHARSALDQKTIRLARKELVTTRRHCHPPAACAEEKSQDAGAPHHIRRDNHHPTRR